MPRPYRELLETVYKHSGNKEIPYCYLVKKKKYSSYITNTYKKNVLFTMPRKGQQNP